MSSFKNLPMSNNERRYLQLRLEAFNAFNHPNLTGQSYSYNVNGPWECADPTTLMSIAQNSAFEANTNTPNTAPGGFRVVQLGAKIYF